jgi:hypothetical protein
MKTGANTLSVLHDIGFVVLAVLILILLSLIVFPFFIAVLPLVIIAGCREIWYLDHLKDTKKT